MQRHVVVQRLLRSGLPVVVLRWLEEALAVGIQTTDIHTRIRRSEERLGLLSFDIVTDWFCVLILYAWRVVAKGAHPQLALVLRLRALAIVLGVLNPSIV